jgi:hypothetical protein
VDGVAISKWGRFNHRKVRTDTTAPTIQPSNQVESLCDLVGEDVAVVVAVYIEVDTATT